jgi:hypothetical protein
MPAIQMQRREQRADQDNAEQSENDDKVADFKLVIDKHDAGLPPVGTG